MTTTEQRCELTDLITTQCAHCRGIDLSPELTIVRHVRAGRRRECATGCDQPINPRQRAAVTAAGQYLHEECAP